MSKRLFVSRLVAIFLILWVVRLIITLTTYGIKTGEVNIPFDEFFFAQMWQMGEILLLFVLVAFFARSPKLRAPLYVILYFLIVVMALLAIIDPIVVALAGDHLTPALLSHFAGPQIFLNDELWLPIKANFVLVSIGVGLTIMCLYSLYKVVHSSHRQYRPLSKSFLILCSLLAALFLWLPHLAQSRFLIYPAEINFFRNAVGLDQFEPQDMDIQSLKSLLAQNQDTIENPDYPLLVTIPKQHQNQTAPNLILLVIESFRAQESILFNPDKGRLELPGLEQFAQHGLIFPYFISNGFPSTEGFMSLSMGIWPHSKDRVVISHQDKHLPSVACRLQSQGYETYRIEDTPDMEEEGFWIQSTFKQHITYTDREILPSTKNMLSDLKKIISEKKVDSTPYYVHLKTRNPHYPYEIEDDQNEQFFTIGTPKENYYASLKAIDKQLMAFYQFMEKEDQLKNTVIIITGDHANYLSKGHINSLPTDETVWTGAIITGPQELIGKPDTILEHASQVDIPTTLLKLAGYSGPWVSFGRDLLVRKNLNETYAIAIRPAGVRLDQFGKTFLIDRSHPFNYIEELSFGNDRLPKDTQRPSFTSIQLLNKIDTWTYLIQQNRVFPKEACTVTEKLP